MGFRWVPKEHKKGRFSKGILVSMLVFLFIFTLSILYIVYKTSYEPSTLITCVFAFCGAEGGFMAWIKKAKESKKGENKNGSIDL